MYPGRAAVRLSKSIEDVRQERWINTLACVADDDRHGGVILANTQFDPAVLRCELDSVDEQIPEHLLQTSGVGQQQDVALFDDEVQVNPFGRRTRLDDVHRRFSRFDEIDGT
jgi:hypothetical protein